MHSLQWSNHGRRMQVQTHLEDMLGPTVGSRHFTEFSTANLSDRWEQATYALGQSLPERYKSTP